MDPARRRLGRRNHGLRHKILNIEGVQFHPESILTEQGHELFANFLKQTGGTR